MPAIEEAFEQFRGDPISDVSFYGSLAPVFEFTFARTYDYEADQFEPVREHLPSNAERVLEIGCGPGLLLQHLATEFETAVGIDSSESMLALARQRTDAQLISGDVREYEPESEFDAVVMVGNLISPITDERDLGTLFEAVHGLLGDDGVFLFDTREFRGRGSIVEHRIAESSRYEVEWDIVTVTKDHDGLRDIAFSFHITDKRTEESVRVGTTMETRARRPEALTGQLREAGFDAVETHRQVTPEPLFLVARRD